MKKRFIFLLIMCHLLAFSAKFCDAQTFQFPETIDDIKNFFQKLLHGIFNVFPSMIKQSFQNGWTIIKNVLGFLKNIWDKYLWGNVKKVLDFFINQINYRLSIFKTEFKKEFQEFLNELKNLLNKIFH